MIKSASQGRASWLTVSEGQRFEIELKKIMQQWSGEAQSKKRKTIQLVHVAAVHELSNVSDDEYTSEQSWQTSSTYKSSIGSQASNSTGVYYKCNVSYWNSIGIHYILLIASTPLHLKYHMNMSLPECSGDSALYSTLNFAYMLKSSWALLSIFWGGLKTL